MDRKYKDRTRSSQNTPGIIFGEKGLAKVQATKPGSVVGDFTGTTYFFYPGSLTRYVDKRDLVFILCPEIVEV